MIYIYYDDTKNTVLYAGVEKTDAGRLIGKMKKMPESNPAFVAHALMNKQKIAFDQGVRVLVAASAA